MFDAAVGTVGLCFETPESVARRAKLDNTTDWQVQELPDNRETHRQESGVEVKDKAGLLKSNASKGTLGRVCRWWRG